MKRRDFLKSTGAAVGLLGCFPANLSSIERDTAKGDGRLERRAYGKTGEKLSIVGFSGFALNKQTPATAADLVAKAIERGVNYFNVAPEYGTSEKLLGPPLKPHRDKVFLACKTAKRAKAMAAAELDRSLKTLHTDRFDLYQLHHVTRLEEVETIFGPGGVMEAILAAKKAGKIRYVGFSAHSVEAAMALMDRFDFDGILFPVNYGTWHAGNFGPQVLERAHKKKMGIAGIKAMAKRPWPKGAKRTWPGCWYEPFSKPEDALMGLRFTLSHPVTTAFPPANPDLLRLGWDVGLKFRPLEAAEAETMKKRAQESKPLFKFPRF